MNFSLFTYVNNGIDTNCGVVALWPAVAVESAATELMTVEFTDNIEQKFLTSLTQGGAEGRALLRKSDVFAAAVVNLSEVLCSYTKGACQTIHMN